MVSTSQGGEVAFWQAKRPPQLAASSQPDQPGATEMLKRGTVRAGVGVAFTLQFRGRRLQAAEAMTDHSNTEGVARTLIPRERELLKAAREGDRDAFGQLVEPFRGSCTRTAIACSAPYVRRRRRAPGDAASCLARAVALRGSKLACAPGCTRIATNACLRADRAAPKRVLPIDYEPAADPHDAARRADRRVGLARAVPRHESSGSRRPRRAGGPLRAARGHRARLHRRAPAPARQPARGADPPRRARLLGPRRPAEILETHRSSVDSALQRAHKTPSTSAFPSQTQQADACVSSATKS